MKLYLFSPLLLSLFLSFSSSAALKIVNTVETDLILDKNDDFHITASTGAIASGVLVDIVSPQSRLYFDNVKPSEFIEKYAPLIRIAGKEFDIDKNARVSVYRHGTMVLPHGSDFAPMKAFEGSDLSGRSEDFLTYKYYSNAPSSDVKKSYSLPLALDDAMRSFTLARGYMATLATNPDGTGYSRCYIADDDDLEVELPFELAGKVSFVRVLDWRTASKKGWVGGNGKTNPPEGYLEEQADMTASTWVYNWGTSPDWGRSPSARTAPWRNQEFVPEKWGLGGDTDWNKIANSRYFTHLLSYNEPDHSEQSNVTVEEAVAEWPRHLSTGLRLGSPATTDFSWLYRFIDACDRLNYRVDYVAIHAYWGGSGSAVMVSSVSDWYKKLKEVHERTGRPIWITEWNNGANWTHESWPSDKAAQQEKQRKFMAEVLEMMDTCSFIERYSVYNWVEEKRALFHGDKNLTPAGKVYRDFEAAAAFSRSEEFVPQWKVGNIASLSLAYAGNGRIRLSWTDADCEQVEGYDVERACGSGQYSLVAKAPYKASSYEMELEGTFSDGADMNYRVVSTDRHGERYPSNTVSCAAIASGGTVLAGRRVMGKGALLHVLPAGAGQAPVAILGTQTYRMKAPMLTTLGAVDSKVCNFGPVSWNYNSSDSFVSRDTVSYIIFPHSGEFDLGGIRAYAGQLAGVTAQPVRVNFPSAFSSAPVVLATAHSADSEYPAVARVGMVTPSGFDLSIVREQKAAGEGEPLAVSYVAIAPGSAELDGHTIACGLARGVEPGVSSTSCARIDYGSDFGTSAFFALPQDGADEGASALRAVTISGTDANIFLNPELAASAPGTSRRDIGWFAISDAGAQSAIAAVASSKASLSYDNAARVLTGPEGTKVRVYTPSGICVLEGSASPELSVAGLASGFYIACASTSASSSVSFCITE